MRLRCASRSLGFLTALVTCLYLPCSPAPISPDRIIQQLNKQPVVQDLCALDLSLVSPRENWVVAEISATPLYSTLTGAYYDGDKRKMVVPPQSHLVLVVSGTVRVLVPLSGATASRLPYKWEESPFGRKNESSLLFRASGTAVMRVNREKSGAEQFGPAYLIPSAWNSLVKPAFERVQAKRDLWTKETALAHRVQLESELLDTNPFVAIAAARTLGQAKFLDEHFIENQLTKAMGWKGSAFTFLVLQQLPSQLSLDLPNAPLTADVIRKAENKALADEPLAEAIGKVIDQAKDAGTLYDITLGLTTASRRSITDAERANKLLLHVDARQKALHTHTPADADLDLLLQTAGVRSRPMPPAPQLPKAKQ